MHNIAISNKNYWGVITDFASINNMMHFVQTGTYSTYLNLLLCVFFILNLNNSRSSALFRICCDDRWYNLKLIYGGISTKRNNIHKRHFSRGWSPGYQWPTEVITCASTDSTQCPPLLRYGTGGEHREKPIVLLVIGATAHKRSACSVPACLLVYCVGLSAVIKEAQRGTHDRQRGNQGTASVTKERKYRLAS